MRIAYYAPMKSPDHPRPSGDRLIARLLIKAMQVQGHKIELMSDLRAWEGKGDQTAQQRIRQQAEAETQRIIAEIQSRPAATRPELWFSYHPYHKAPDWIGPAVSKQLSIPYVIAEAIYAIDQQHGPWADGLTHLIPTLKQANAILCLNPLDIPALKRLPESRNKLHPLHPFLDTQGVNLQRNNTKRQQLAERYQLDPTQPWIICVAMMRDDAKLVSYQHLARSVSLLKQPFQLLLIGDGQARQQVEALFSGTLATATRYAGQLDQQATFEAMLAADLFIWPAYKEAIGMAILEAQACGLPVIAGNSGAIPDIVANGKSGFLCAPDDHAQMAAATDQLLRQPSLRKQFSETAAHKFQQQHTLSAAAEMIEQALIEAKSMYS